jgi:acetyl esterase
MTDRVGLAPDIRDWLIDTETQGAPALSELDPPAGRRALADTFGFLWGQPGDFEGVSDRVVPIAEGEIAVRVYRPHDGRLPAIVYLHGGGWVVGSIDTHDGLCRELARDSGAVVVSVNYRLAPEHPFPAAPDDVTAAMLWLFTNADALDVDLGRMSLAGDSAGGNLAAVVTRRLVTAGMPIASQVLVYPVTDTRTDTASYQRCADGFGLTRDDMVWYLDHYLPPGADRADPDCAPLRALDLSGLPPTYVATCEHDPLRDEGAAYAARLAAAGVDVVHDDAPGMIHGYLLMRTITPAADDLRKRIIEFLQRSWTSYAAH